MSAAAELILDRYRAIRRLAVGGMGEVFLAEDSDGRRVVLKTMLPELAADQGFVTQFLEEAKLCAWLDHPNIVKQVAQGWWGTSPILVLEYVRGRTVSQLVRRAKAAGTPLPLTVVAQLGADAARGLAAAHRAVNDEGRPLHIVHRDVSPQNLLVGTDGRTRVLDFGIALSTERSVRTTTGIVRGKAAYLSPEQIRRSDVTGAADQFALAVVLWEAASGQRLFRGEGEALLLAVLEHPIPLPSSAGLPVELDLPLSRMLERDPTLRFDSLDDVAARLEAIASADGPAAVRRLMATLGEDDLDPNVDSPIVLSATTRTQTAQLAAKTEGGPQRPGTRRLVGLTLAAAALTAALASGVGAHWETPGNDLLLRLRGPLPTSPELVHVDIDDSAVRDFGRWPWPRSLQARLVSTLAMERPAAVLFDLVWSEPSAPAEDEALQLALSELERRWLPSVFQAGSGWFRPLPRFEVGAQAPTHNAVEPDDDGRWRRASAALEADRRTLPHPSVAVSQALGRPQPRVDAQGRLLITWPGPWASSFTHVPAGVLLRGEAAPLSLAGKTVIVGVTAWGHSDVHDTPLERQVPSPFVHSSLMSAAWLGRELREASPVLQSVALLGLLLSVSLLARWRGASWGVLGAAGASLGWLAVAMVALWADRVVWTTRPVLTLGALALGLVWAARPGRVRR